MPRGGRRKGTPGKAYPNRSDLAAQPVRTVPSQQYGQATQQANAQKAIPLPAAAPVQTAPAPAPFTPPEPGLLHAPSTRPAEPVTAGLPMGAGPGPEALATNSINTSTENDIRTLYRMFPVEELRQIVEKFEARRGVS